MLDWRIYLVAEEWLSLASILFETPQQQIYKGHVMPSQPGSLFATMLGSSSAPLF